MADTKIKITNSTPRKIRRVLRVIAYNVLFTFIGLGFIALTGEVYLRLKRSMMPFSTRRYHLHFVPKVGAMLKPNDEVRWSNLSDFSTISRTNSLGFLDREPISSKTRRGKCHITMIGDSFVESREVPIADKFHVRLEELAARHLPHLDITTSAFGRNGTGQINQLPYYDEFARHLSPKLVVLVFVRNDFNNNSPIWSALQWEIYPDRQPFVTVERDEDGTLKLRPPHPDWQMFRLPRLPNYHYTSILGYLYLSSHFVRGLKNNNILSFNSGTLWTARKELLRPDYKSSFVSGLSATAFALDQFVERTERDGGSLVILATYNMGTRGHAFFDRMSALAEARGIPVIDQYDYIRRQGGEMREAHWTKDFHWNEQGHQWATEALLEYLMENPEICTRPADTGTP